MNLRELSCFSGSGNLCCISGEQCWAMKCILVWDFFPFRHCVGKASKPILSPLRSVLFLKKCSVQVLCWIGTMTNLECEQWQQTHEPATKLSLVLGFLVGESEAPHGRWWRRSPGDPEFGLFQKWDVALSMTPNSCKRLGLRFLLGQEHPGGFFAWCCLFCPQVGHVGLLQSSSCSLLLFQASSVKTSSSHGIRTDYASFLGSNWGCKYLAWACNLACAYTVQ